MAGVKRRHVIKALAGSGLMVPALATPALSSGRQELTMLTAWPRSMTPLHNTAERMARRIETLSDGKIGITLFAANERVSALETLDALQSGAADLVHGTSYYWTGRSPSFALFATVPFGMMAEEHRSWLTYGGGQDLWDEVGATVGVKPLPAGNSGVQTAGWFREQIRTRRDLEGKVVRFPALGGELFRSVGAIPRTTAASDIGPMLESGALDGAEWVSPWVDLQFGLQKYCRYCYYPGVHEPGHMMELNVALPTWDRFDDHTKAVFKAASDAECSAVPAEFAAKNAQAVGDLIAQHQVEFLRLPNDVVRAMRLAAPDVMADFMGDDPFSQEVMRSYLDFKDGLGRWAEFADRAYWRARFT